ncbi:unnamed protein product, partial [Ectocarpus sp. 12 AP-2014]
MATAREQLAGTSEKLRLAFSSLQAVEEEVGARTAGLGALSLSQASASVSQAASMAKAEAVKVVKAADAAEAAAARAAEVVSVAQAARVAAAAQSAAAQAAVEAAEAALAAVAALEADIEPPAGMARMPGGSKSGSKAQGAMSCSGSQVEHFEFSVAIKAGESEVSEDEEEHSTSPTVEATPEAGITHQERRQEDTHGTDRGKEEEEEAPLRGKRKLGGTGEAPRRQSVRATGRLQPNYAESPTREPSKCQRKASKSGTGEDCEGGEAVQQGRRQRDYSSDTMDRHNAGVAKGTAAQHGDCTTMKPDFCSKRAKQGNFHISKTFGHPGCMKRSPFGADGSKNAEFCAQHETQGMIDLVNKRCGHPGCIKSPSFGEHGSTKRDLCSQHAKQ